MPRPRSAGEESLQRRRKQVAGCECKQVEGEIVCWRYSEGVMVEAWRRSTLGGAGKGARYRGALRGSGWAGGAAECLGQPWGWGCPGGAVGLVAAWGGQQDWASFPQMPLKVPVELELAEGGCRTRSHLLMGAQWCLRGLRAQGKAFAGAAEG